MDLSHPLDELLGANRGRILHRLAVVSEELTGRRVAELSGVPVVSAARVLADLERIGLVTTKSIGSARAYRLNRAHVLWAPIEAVLAAPARIEQIAAEAVRDRVGSRATLATFGSFARGEAGAASDIDLLIVWDETVSAEDRSSVLDAVNERVAQATGSRVEIVELDESTVQTMVRKGDPLVESWRRDARTLTGPDVKMRLSRTR